MLKDYRIRFTSGYLTTLFRTENLYSVEWDEMMIMNSVEVKDVLMCRSCLFQCNLLLRHLASETQTLLFQLWNSVTWQRFEPESSGIEACRLTAQTCSVCQQTCEAGHHVDGARRGVIHKTVVAKEGGVKMSALFSWVLQRNRHTLEDCHEPLQAFV
jgi:hypothetical protein